MGCSNLGEWDMSLGQWEVTGGLLVSGSVAKREVLLSSL